MATGPYTKICDTLGGSIGVFLVALHGKDRKKTDMCKLF